MKKKSTMKLAALAAVIILALFCTTAFAEPVDIFANGLEKGVDALNPKSLDSVYGGSLNGAVQSTKLIVNTDIPLGNAFGGVFGGGKASSGDSVTPLDSSASVSGDTQLYLMNGYNGSKSEASYSNVYGGGYADPKGVHTVYGNTDIQMQNPLATATRILGGGRAEGYTEVDAYSIVKGNSKVVSPKICTKLGLLKALITISAVTVESFPPEKDSTICSSSNLLAVFLIKEKASSLSQFNLFLFACTNFVIYISKY